MSDHRAGSRRAALCRCASRFHAGVHHGRRLPAFTGLQALRERRLSFHFLDNTNP